MTHSFLDRPSHPRLAYCRSPALAGRPLPSVLFLGGFRSDMTGTKAVALESACRSRGQGYIRFDYRGHGASAGRFEESVLSDWKADALTVLDELAEGPVILAGSSMGGWLSLLLALERPGRIAGLVGIAAAPDFTRDMTRALNPAQLDALQRQSWIDVPNHYSDQPYRITKALLKDGEKHCVLDKQHDLAIPMKLVHGALDADVPSSAAGRIRDAFPRSEIEIVLVADGEHRLSRPRDLELIDRKIQELVGAAARAF